MATNVVTGYFQDTSRTTKSGRIRGSVGFKSLHICNIIIHTLIQFFYSEYLSVSTP